MFLFFIIIIFLHFMLLFLWQVVQATHKVEEIIWSAHRTMKVEES